MRAILIALILTFATQAGAECGNLCDPNWWRTATEADVQAELDGGADVMARTDTGWTPLHSAALAGTVTFNAKPANIQALLDAGAGAKAKNKEGKTPWDFAQETISSKAPKATGR